VTKEGKEYLELLVRVRVHMVRINYRVITADKRQKDCYEKEEKKVG
jgi:hypothetical protein